MASLAPADHRLPHPPRYCAAGSKACALCCLLQTSQGVGAFAVCSGANHWWREKQEVRSAERKAASRMAALRATAAAAALTPASLSHASTTFRAPSAVLAAAVPSSSSAAAAEVEEEEEEQGGEGSRNRSRRRRTGFYSDYCY